MIRQTHGIHSVTDDNLFDIRAVEVAAFDIALYEWESGEYREARPMQLTHVHQLPIHVHTSIQRVQLIQQSHHSLHKLTTVQTMGWNPYRKAPSTAGLQLRWLPFS